MCTGEHTELLAETLWGYQLPHGTGKSTELPAEALHLYEGRIDS